MSYYALLAMYLLLLYLYIFQPSRLLLLLNPSWVELMFWLCCVELALKPTLNARLVPAHSNSTDVTAVPSAVDVSTGGASGGGGGASG